VLGQPRDLASFIPLTIGSIDGDGRSSSRISTSWFSINSFGWPAMDGRPGLVELPPGPWQVTQLSWAATSKTTMAVSNPVAHRHR